MKDWIECGEYFERSQVHIFDGLVRQKPEILNIAKQLLLLACSFSFLLPQARQKLEHRSIDSELGLHANNRQSFPYDRFPVPLDPPRGDYPFDDECLQPLHV